MTLAEVRRLGPRRDIRAAVRLSEWSEMLPAAAGPGRVLANMSFGNDAGLRARATELDRAGVVSITERRDGLAIETRSFIGRLAVGPVEITIVPKISWGRWLTLVRYALRLRSVVWTERLDVQLDAMPLQDLVIMELLREARDLFARGLHREYERYRAPLATPRGRVDLQRIARRGGLHEAAVPCRFTKRSENSPLNRALAAGLRFAAGRATDRGLRFDTQHLALELERTIALSSVSKALLEAARAAVDRRTRRYEPALRLIRLLFEGDSITLEDHPEHPTVLLRGFAIDMNRIWQQLLARVLREWTEGVDVREEFAIKGVFQRDPLYASRGRVPRPRPDFAAFHDGRLLGYLDAKYRDLWEHHLPREMLYQLSLYAMAQGHGVATILYPTDSLDATEQRLNIHDPLNGKVRASVALRPVPLSLLDSLIDAPPSSARMKGRRALAQSLLALT